MNDYNLTEILEYIDPSTCSYQEDKRRYGTKTRGIYGI